MRVRHLITALTVAVCTAMVAASGAIASTEDCPKNPWLKQLRFLHMAHQGGENEAPSNTLYAFKRSVRIGADMLELDAHGTADGKLAVSHDATVDRTTNGTGRIVDMTLAQVQALDAGYDFTIDGVTYPYRGIRTGDVPPPRGYRARDFKIPSLDEVLAAFPRTPINIEIKGTADADTASYLRNAELLARKLNASGRRDFIVVSFEDLAVKRFHELAPRFATAPGVARIAEFLSTGAELGFGTKALQVPIQFSGIPVTTPEFVKRAHDRGYAVHVWLDAATEESDAVYNRLIDMCVDGIMTANPTRLERLLDERGIVRPHQPGVDPCA